MNKKQKIIISIAGFLGTFVSLSCYLTAVKIGHLASISAVAGTSPLFATLFETLSGKKHFSIYLLMGILFFVAGFLILVLNW